MLIKDARKYYRELRKMGGEIINKPEDHGMNIVIFMERLGPTGTALFTFGTDKGMT